jgi:mannosyl-oligosaccharide glucosidase
MTGYGWDKYDPRYGGIQTMHDADNGIDITTSFVKISEAGDKGGNWAVRIKGSPRSGAREDLKTTVVFSVASQGSGLTGLEVAGDLEQLKDPRGLEGDVIIKGENPSLGPFKIVITERLGRHPTHDHPSAEDRPLDRSQVASVTHPENILWQTKGKCYEFNIHSRRVYSLSIALLFNQLRGSIDTYLEKYGQENTPPPFQLFTLKNNAGVGNQHFVQKVFEGEFEVN